MSLHTGRMRIDVHLALTVTRVGSQFSPVNSRAVEFPIEFHFHFANGVFDPFLLMIWLAGVKINCHVSEVGVVARHGAVMSHPVSLWQVVNRVQTFYCQHL